MVKTRKKNRRRVLTWFASWWRNHRPKQAEKPHSKSSGRKALDGPATRPKTPLAVENGVGKLTASERGAPNVGMGKRAWRTPSPHLSLLDRKAGQGLIVSTGGKTSNAQHPTSNQKMAGSASDWMFGVGCSMFDVFQFREKIPLALAPN
jgi:hypothetical protein